MSDNANQFRPVQKSKNKKTHKRLIIVIAVLTVLVIGVGAWVYISNRKAPVSQELVATDQQLINTKQEIDAQATAGDTSGALNAYDEAIATAADSSAKRSLLISKATVAFNSNNFVEALKSIKLADGIKSDYNTLGFMANIYDKMGDIKNAIVFYTKAANFESEFNYDIGIYKARVVELQGKINE